MSGLLSGYIYHNKLKDECNEWNNFACNNIQFAYEDSYELRYSIMNSTYRSGKGTDNFIILTNADAKEIKLIGNRLQKDSGEALLNMQQYPTSSLIKSHIKEEKAEYELMLRDFEKAGEYAVIAAEYWENAKETCDFTDSADYTYVDLSHENFVKANEYCESGNEHYRNALRLAMETSLTFYGYEFE
jgi:hypothetical protein